MFFSPLDELFYNKLPAGVRKPEINGFRLPQKTHTKTLLKSLHRETVTRTQPFAHIPVFIWSHFSPLLHLLSSFSMENGFHSRAELPPTQAFALSAAERVMEETTEEGWGGAAPHMRKMVPAEGPGEEHSLLEGKCVYNILFAP